MIAVKIGIPRGRLSGFSLMEAVFVIVIIGILAAAVIPRVGRGGLLDRYTVYTAAHKISADMRYARRLAVTTGDRHRVACYATGGSSDYNSYQIESNATGNWTLVGVAKDIPDDITVSGDSTATFQSDGSATAAGTFTYVLDSYTYEIDVIAATGRAKLTQS